MEMFKIEKAQKVRNELAGGIRMSAFAHYQDGFNQISKKFQEISIKSIKFFSKKSHVLVNLYIPCAFDLSTFVIIPLLGQKRSARPFNSLGHHLLF